MLAVFPAASILNCEDQSTFEQRTPLRPATPPAQEPCRLHETTLVSATSYCLPWQKRRIETPMDARFTSIGCAATLELSTGHPTKRSRRCPQTNLTPRKCSGFKTPPSKPEVAELWKGTFFQIRFLLNPLRFRSEFQGAVTSSTSFSVKVFGFYRSDPRPRLPSPRVELPPPRGVFSGPITL